MKKEAFVDKKESEYERRARLKYQKFIFNRKGLIIFISVMIAFLFTIFLRPWYVATVNNMIGFNSWRSAINNAELQVHIVDVGQGDAIAIKLPDNKTMLIDAGQENEKVKLKNYLSNVFFVGQEKKFDYVLLTHCDSDHCGGMSMVYDEYKIDCSFRPIRYSTTAQYERTPYASNVNQSDNLYYGEYIDKVYSENDSEVVYLSSFVNYKYYPQGFITGSDNLGGEYRIIFLTNNNDYYAELNDTSSVILIQYAGKNLIFTGDAETKCFDEIDEAILELGINSVDFYKASHHGSSVNEANRQSTLFDLNPSYVAISVGKYNGYGHPNQGFLNTLTLLNIDGNHIFRTDSDSSCIFSVDANSNIKTAKHIASKMVLPFIWEITYLIVAIIAYVVCFYNREYKGDKDE